MADLELIDAFEFVVQPVLAGHGPTLLADIQRKVALPFRVGRRIPGSCAALTVGDSWDVTHPSEQIDQLRFGLLSPRQPYSEEVQGAGVTRRLKAKERPPTAERASREVKEMRPLRYSINVTLDGCVHHEAGLPPDEESMRYWTAEMERADALLFGRVTYAMMQSAWRKPAAGRWPDWMDEWQIPFAEAIDRAKKYVVSNTLSGIDWNADLLRGDVGPAVQRLKQEPGEGLWVGGVTLPLTLADLDLIDEYEFVVQPVLAGHGPTLLSGLRERIQLELVDRHEFRSGAVALRYRPRRVTA